jgi:hypothetical protein
MAEEQEVYLPDDLGTPPKKSKKKRILQILLVLVLLIVLVIGGFLLGIYLKIFDTNEMNEKLGLYDLPIIGQFFVKPAPKNSDIPDEPEDEDTVEDNKDDKQQKQIVLSKKEIEKQKKEQQAAEKKRISKLARLYNEMKPADAAAVMDDLDDDMTIAILQKMDEGQASKILSVFDPDKSARLTKIMYVGMKRKMESASDSNMPQGNGTAPSDNPNGAANQ